MHFRRKADTVRGRGPESVRRGSRDTKQVPTPEFENHDDLSLQVTSDGFERRIFLVASFT